MAFRVLVTDGIDRDGVALLASEPELEIDEVPTPPPGELLERIGDYDAFIGRAATRLTGEVLRRASRLRVVGRAGVGVDNIALDEATRLGIAVINAPAGNTVAVAELLFGALLSLLRHLPRAAESMRAGRWDRAELLGTELRGKTLGVVGLGRIGGEVAIRARAFEMECVGFDPYVAGPRFEALRVRRAESLAELLDASDVVTLHTPLTAETRGLLGRGELARLRPGAVVANLARGGIVDEEALLAALASNHLRGAVLDVFATEPLGADHPLRRAANVFLTPHIGANTREAQRNVAVDVCAAVRDVLLTGELSRSINIAALEGGGQRSWQELRPALLVARRAAAVARALLADQGTRAVHRVALRCGVALAGGREALLAAAAIGVLEDVIESERLNLINARAQAEARGIDLTASHAPQLAESAVEVSLHGTMQELTVAGAAPTGAPPRLTRIGGFHVDVAVDVPSGQSLIVLTNRDVPGVIGHVGTLFGTAGVNIAEYHQARQAQGGDALAAVTVDGTVDGALRERLLALPDVLSATVVQFRDA